MAVAMKLMSTFCLLFSIAYANEQVTKANNYIDEFIAKATKDQGAFIDPYPLEEYHKGFEKKVGFMTIKGDAKLYNGTITGLSTIRRVGDTSVIDLDDILMIATQMSFKKVKAFYKGAVLVNDLGPKVTLNAAVGSSNVSMFIVVPAEGGNATLLSFNILKLSDIRVSVSGLGPWGWAASVMSSFALNALEKPVAKAASLHIQEVFGKEIEKTPYPG